MAVPLREAMSLLDPGVRRRLPLVVASFAGVAVLDAIGIGLVFPLVLAISDPASLEEKAWIARLAYLLGVDSAARLAFVLGAGVAGVFVVKNVLTVLLLRWQYGVLFAAEAEVGTRLLARYLSMPWESVSARNSSELIRNASVSTSHLFLSFFVPLLTVVVELSLVIVIVAVLLFVDVAVALTAAFLLGLAALVYYALVRNLLHATGVAFQRANFDVLNDLKQGIGAGRELRILGRDQTFVDRLARSRASYAKAQQTRSVLQQIPRYYLEALLVVAVIGALTVAVATRPLEEVAPVLAVFGVAGLRLINSASRLLASFQQIRIGAPAVMAVYDDLSDSAPAPRRAPASASASASALAPTQQRGMRVERVGFWYRPEVPVLRDIDLVVEPGESIGIMGASGAGKSTLLDLILGLVEPRAGRITIDGADIRNDLRGWRQRLGYVPQSVYLTDESLRSNVAFGVAEDRIDDARVLRALELAQLRALVETLPHGLGSRLGELGTTLSGGQRQRVAIARALYHDPDILLLDEATSALDDDTESAIVDTLDALKGRKSIIVITHRHSTLRSCDRVVMLQAGILTPASRQPSSIDAERPSEDESVDARR